MKKFARKGFMTFNSIATIIAFLVLGYNPASMFLGINNAMAQPVGKAGQSSCIQEVWVKTEGDQVRVGTNMLSGAVAQLGHELVIQINCPKTRPSQVKSLDGLVQTRADDSPSCGFVRFTVPSIDLADFRPNQVEPYTFKNGRPGHKIRLSFSDGTAFDLIAARGTWEEIKALQKELVRQDKRIVTLEGTVERHEREIKALQKVPPPAPTNPTPDAPPPASNAEPKDTTGQFRLQAGGLARGEMGFDPSTAYSPMGGFEAAFGYRRGGLKDMGFLFMLRVQMYRLANYSTTPSADSRTTWAVRQTDRFSAQVALSFLADWYTSDAISIHAGGDILFGVDANRYIDVGQRMDPPFSVWFNNTRGTPYVGVAADLGLDIWLRGEHRGPFIWLNGQFGVRTSTPTQADGPVSAPAIFGQGAGGLGIAWQ